MINRDFIQNIIEGMPEKYSYAPLPAARLLYAIGLQETGFKCRSQYNGGPAKGYFQFEPIACQEVINRDRALLEKYQLPTERTDLYKAIQWSEVGMVISARIFLYYASPFRLPKRNESALGWQNYIRAWRPGKPHPHRWELNWKEASKDG